MSKHWWTVSLPLVAVALLVAATLVESRREIEDATVARYQTERRALAEAGAHGLQVTLDAVRRRLSDPALRAYSGVERARTPSEIAASLRLLAGDFSPDQVIFFAHSRDGRLVAVDPAVDPELAGKMLAHVHHGEAGTWDDGTGVCPMCAEELHAVSLVEPLAPTAGDGVLLAANVRLDRVADGVLSSLALNGHSSVCLLSAEGHRVVCRGSASGETLSLGVPVRGYPLTMSAATAKAAVVADVAHRTLWMLVAAVLAIGLVGVAAGLALWGERRRHREEVAATARMAEIDKLASLGTMAAGVMHEIASPLAAVLANVDMLEQVRPEEIPDVRRETLDAVQRIQAIADDLRRFSRRAEGSPQAFELRQPVAAAVRLARPATKHACHVDVRLPVPLWVKGNAQHVTQIVLNLISNAAHALRGRPYHEARVTVSARTAGDHVELAVEDTGPGVAAENEPKLFSLFFTTKPPGEGTGLGLALSARLAAEAGGRLRYEAASPGARFVVELPLAEAAVPEPVPQDRRGDRPSAAPTKATT